MGDITRKRWAQRAQALQFGQLDQIRAQAEKWRNGLVAVTALFAVVSIIKGPERITDLSDDNRIAVVVLLGVAFVLLVLGSVFAMRAAFGVPRLVRLTGENLQRWEGMEAREARGWLRAGQICSIAGVMAVAAGIGITWLNRAPEPRVAVQMADNTIYCGELATSRPGELTIRAESAAGKVVRSVPYSGVIALRVVRKCP